jgi:predicted component of type VI protein secretion system
MSEEQLSFMKFYVRFIQNILNDDSLEEMSVGALRRVVIHLEDSVSELGIEYGEDAVQEMTEAQMKQYIERNIL